MLYHIDYTCIYIFQPRNIFLHEPELHVKIGDFGLAKGAFGSDYKDDVLLTPTPDTEGKNR